MAVWRCAQAVANLFLVLQLDEMAMPEWPFWLLIHIVVELAREVHTWLEHERYRSMLCHQSSYELVRPPEPRLIVRETE